KSQPLVDLDRANIVLADVQKWRFFAVANALHDFRHQKCGIALARVLRMRADRTHLCVARNLQALTRHRNQLSLRANAQVRSQFVGATAKRPRLRQGSQFNHLPRVWPAKFYQVQAAELRVESGLRSPVVGNHLQQGRTRHETPTGSRLVWVIEEQPDRPADSNESGQRRIAPLPMLPERAQRADFANKAPRLVEALGELCVAGSQRLPDHIVEWVHKDLIRSETSEQITRALPGPAIRFLRRDYSFRSTCCTSSIGCPRKRSPSRRNFSTESVAKNLSRGGPRRSSRSAVVGTSCSSREATAPAVDSAESTMLTWPGVTRCSSGLSNG